jgi:hypothetical protein
MSTSSIREWTTHKGREEASKLRQDSTSISGILPAIHFFRNEYTSIHVLEQHEGVAARALPSRCLLLRAPERRASRRHLLAMSQGLFS